MCRETVENERGADRPRIVTKTSSEDEITIIEPVSALLIQFAQGTERSRDRARHCGWLPGEFCDIREVKRTIERKL
jgi:hypothetical protein